jgi:DNA-binding response OmpR family regulator
LRILLAEGSRDAAAAQSLLLKLWGHDVRVAANGIDALRLAAEYRPHVAISELVLPLLDGYEFARRLRAQKYGNETVLIALTGMGSSADVRRAGAAGFNLHFIKPVAPDTLQRTLESLVQVRGPQSSPHPWLSSERLPLFFRSGPARNWAADGEFSLRTAIY